MSGKNYLPPYSITDTSVHLIAAIGELLGRAAVKNQDTIGPLLRKDNQIRTIHSSLAIENNSLSLEQVTDVINGKRILGAPKEILEVKNAYEAYKLLHSFDPLELRDLLRAHKTLMQGLTDESGRFRSGGVGIFAGGKLVHMAPPPSLVPELMGNLLDWAKNSDTHPLIKSCVFHYEFEFIHPFSDGNGRMGRMWQTLLLGQWQPLFYWLPVETLIHERQAEYYAVLAAADKASDSAVFIEFMLRALLDALGELCRTDQVTEQVEHLLLVLGNETLSAKELLEHLGLKHRPSFSKNYLHPALERGLIEMTVPGKPNSKMQKYRAVKNDKR